MLLGSLDRRVVSIDYGDGGGGVMPHVGDGVDGLLEERMAAMEHAGLGPCDLQDPVWAKMSALAAGVTKKRKKSDTKPQAQINKCNNEKRRREQENIYIEELAELISANFADMSSLSVKPDKCAILQETVNQIQRIKQRESAAAAAAAAVTTAAATCATQLQVINRVGSSAAIVAVANSSDPVQQGEVSSSRPSILSTEVYTPLLLEALEGFLFVVNSEGRVEHVTENVSTYIHYGRDEVLGKSVYNFLHHGDHGRFSACLMPGTAGPVSCWPNNEQGPAASASKSRSFTCRFLIKPTEDQDETMEEKQQRVTSYELMQISSIQLRDSSTASTTGSTSGTSSGDRSNNSSSAGGGGGGGGGSEAEEETDGGGPCLLCVASRITTREKVMNSAVTNVEQFTTKLDLNGKVIGVDTSGVTSPFSTLYLTRDRLLGVLWPSEHICASRDDIHKVGQHLRETLNHGQASSVPYRLKMGGTGTEQRFVCVQTKSKLFKTNVGGDGDFVMATHSILQSDSDHLPTPATANTLIPNNALTHHPATPSPLSPTTPAMITLNNNNSSSANNNNNNSTIGGPLMTSIVTNGVGNGGSRNGGGDNSNSSGSGAGANVVPPSASLNQIFDSDFSFIDIFPSSSLEMDYTSWTTAADTNSGSSNVITGMGGVGRPDSRASAAATPPVLSTPGTPRPPSAAPTSVYSPAPTTAQSEPSPMYGAPVSVQQQMQQPSPSPGGPASVHNNPGTPYSSSFTFSPLSTTSSSHPHNSDNQPHTPHPATPYSLPATSPPPPLTPNNNNNTKIPNNHPPTTSNNATSASSLMSSSDSSARLRNLLTKPPTTAPADTSQQQQQQQVGANRILKGLLNQQDEAVVDAVIQGQQGMVGGRNSPRGSGAGMKNVGATQSGGASSSSSGGGGNNMLLQLLNEKNDDDDDARLPGMKKRSELLHQLLRDDEEKQQQQQQQQHHQQQSQSDTLLQSLGYPRESSPTEIGRARKRPSDEGDSDPLHLHSHSLSQATSTTTSHPNTGSKLYQRNQMLAALLAKEPTNHQSPIPPIPTSVLTATPQEKLPRIDHGRGNNNMLGMQPGRIGGGNGMVGRPRLNQQQAVLGRGWGGSQVQAQLVQQQVQQQQVQQQQQQQQQQLSQQRFAQMDYNTTTSSSNTPTTTASSSDNMWDNGQSSDPVLSDLLDQVIDIVPDAEISNSSDILNLLEAIDQSNQQQVLQNHQQLMVQQQQRLVQQVQQQRRNIVLVEQQQQQQLSEDLRAKMEINNIQKLLMQCENAVVAAKSPQVVGVVSPLNAGAVGTVGGQGGGQPPAYSAQTPAFLTSPTPPPPNYPRNPQQMGAQSPRTPTPGQQQMANNNNNPNRSPLYLNTSTQQQQAQIQAQQIRNNQLILQQQENKRRLIEQQRHQQILGPSGGPAPAGAVTSVADLQAIDSFNTVAPNVSLQRAVSVPEGQGQQLSPPYAMNQNQRLQQGPPGGAQQASLPSQTPPYSPLGSGGGGSTIVVTSGGGSFPQAGGYVTAANARLSPQAQQGGFVQQQQQQLSPRQQQQWQQQQQQQQAAAARLSVQQQQNPMLNAQLTANYPQQANSVPPNQQQRFAAARVQTPTSVQQQQQHQQQQQVSNVRLGSPGGGGAAGSGGGSRHSPYPGGGVNGPGSPGGGMMAGGQPVVYMQQQGGQQRLQRANSAPTATTHLPGGHIRSSPYVAQQPPQQQQPYPALQQMSPQQYQHHMQQQQHMLQQQYHMQQHQHHPHQHHHHQDPPPPHPPPPNIQYGNSNYDPASVSQQQQQQTGQYNGVVMGGGGRPPPSPNGHPQMHSPAAGVVSNTTGNTSSATSEFVRQELRAVVGARKSQQMAPSRQQQQQQAQAQAQAQQQMQQQQQQSQQLMQQQQEYEELGLTFEMPANEYYGGAGR